MAFVGAVLAAAVVFGLASPARADDRVFWANRFSTTISFANLDGSGGGNQLPLTGATPTGPFGIGMDPASNKIYWPNAGNDTISFANLDGTGDGGQLNPAPASVATAAQMAMDLPARRVYWSNAGGSTLSYANLDGPGGGDVPIVASALDQPFGVAVDPAAGRIYWANHANNTIGVANLDGSGSATIVPGSATVNGPIGVALDTIDHRLYWANFSVNKISYVDLNDAGSGDLKTTGATVSNPEGLAIDHAAGRVYWANSNMGSISYANTDNSGGGHDLNLAGASPSQPTFPVLLKAPVGTGVPAVIGGPFTGSVLSCTNGSWEGDHTPESEFQAPHSFTFQWLLNGTPIAGANGATVTAASAGSYQCAVTALNAAGGTSQTSAAVTVQAPPPPPPPPPDTDKDGIADPADRCATVPAGAFDADHDGCPGPYAALRISTAGSWSVSNAGVRLGAMKVQGLTKGVTVVFRCEVCHIRQTLTSTGSSINLKKLKGKLLRRAKSFTLTATGTGLIGDMLTVTVKNYGHSHADVVRASRAPFKARHACIPVGSTTPAKACSATPPTGP